ncbi:delta-lactam-biosynthetic de-N-acetylase [Bacillus piscicola]|uniref:delta-lactam-biosynthetic de-N-acetylase n=1 Tax=Bacillus piscicola TaxID=1632684 RepID=UPI001F08FB97|nr:delta-lactam-biosynthetic de-N-acetylase [Bacillus piscicola]
MRRLLFTIFLICSLFFTGTASAEEVYDWNFKPSQNNEPADTERTYKVLLDKYGGLFIGNTSKKELYLTFDNGYENGYTEKILDVLQEKEVPAAFFVTGHYLKSAPKLVKRMVHDGHIVGNHSWHHPSLPEISDERLEEELAKVKNEFKQLTGEEDMFYLRPPQGKFSEHSLAKTQDLGYVNVFWSFAYMDWDTDKQMGEKAAYEAIMGRIHPGAVMLLHSVSKDNAEVLGKVIEECRKQGYTFKSLDELIFENWMSVGEEMV